MKNVLLFAASIAFAGSSASAATVGFDLTIDDSINVPHFTITNTSATETLDALSFTIGDTSRNFDYVQEVDTSALSSYTIVSGSTANGGSRYDLIELAFGGFTFGEMITFRTDIDPDNTNTNQDYRTVLFNNGGAPNSVFTATFSSGDVLSYELPDGATNATSYSFSATNAATVPLPATLPLFLAGLGGLAMVRRRR